jgi:glycerol-3-phosphate acyltransferase PlsX
MRIGIDVMGGDFAPNAILEGAILAQKELPSSDTIVLIGSISIIREYLRNQKVDENSFAIVHTDEFIEMGENPARAYTQKPNSSIGLGFHMLRRCEIDGFASAGNTGAMLVGAMFTSKSVPGIIRPCIAAVIPSLDEKPGILLDVGINPDARPDVLYQYGLLGALYAEYVFQIQNPKVGLLNIGSEDEKGNLVTKATYQLMKGTTEFNFIGNVEGNEFFDNEKFNVLVADGFVGNVMLKQAESFYQLAKKKNILDPFFEQFNFENYGGTPILGINHTAIIGHGISNGKAIKNMILHTHRVIEVKLTEHIKAAFNNDKN